MSEVPATLEPLVSALETALAAEDLERALTSAKAIDDALQTLTLDAAAIRVIQRRLQSSRVSGEDLRSEARSTLVARQRSRGPLRDYQRIARSGLARN